MKRKSIGKRIGLALAAVAIGFAIWIIWAFLFGVPPDLAGKILETSFGLVVMGYLIYRWSIK